MIQSAPGARVQERVAGGSMEQQGSSGRDMILHDPDGQSERSIAPVSKEVKIKAGRSLRIVTRGRVQSCAVQVLVT